MKLLGLIGYPLSHSFSKEYFSRKFELEGLKDWKYELFPILHVREIWEILENNEELAGFNVTIPHKQAIIPLLDELTAEAQAVGAVNTVKVKPGGGRVKLAGYNTDVFGFEESLAPLLKPYHRKALILGTGGGSKAVQFALRKMGIEFILASRKAESGITYSSVTPEMVSAHKLIVNTTPCGMFPDMVDYPPIPYEGIGPEHLLYDLIYNPEETVFLKKGAGSGAAIKNGLEMLHLQAEKAWEIWTQ